MTDPHDPNPLDPLDDVASAHLDGQATEAEAARVAADPELAARVAALAAVRAALQSDGPPVDDARREASIAAALTAFDADGGDEAAPAGPGGVTPIAVAAARRRVSRRSVQIIGAVAVAVLLAIAVPLLGVLDSDSDSPSEVATSALEESAQDSAERDGGDATAGDASALAPSAGGAYSATAPVDLGSFDDIDALKAAAGTYASPLAAATDDMATATTTARVAEAAPACSDAPDSGSRVVTGTATLDGRPVLVRVYQRPDGERTVVVLDAADCSIVSS